MMEHWNFLHHASMRKMPSRAILPAHAIWFSNLYRNSSGSTDHSHIEITPLPPVPSVNCRSSDQPSFQLSSNRRVLDCFVWLESEAGSALRLDNVAASPSWTPCSI